MTDGLYNKMELRIAWSATLVAAVDAARNHERDFDAFAKMVTVNLMPAGHVVSSYTGGERDKYRDFTFISDRPIEQSDWTTAVKDAASACCVHTDQNDWGFE